MHIKQVELENLHLDPANARSHGDVNMDAIEASLSRFGPAPISIGDRTDRWRRSTMESFLRKKEEHALTAGLYRGSMS